MYLIKRGSTYYFNRRIRTKILRISLRLTKRPEAGVRAAHLFVFVSRCIRRGMNYEKIKRLAREEAQRMHDEWVLEHFSKKPLSDYDEEIESYLQVEKQEMLHEGRVAPDQLQEVLSFIMYVTMREKTMYEWSRPKALLDSVVSIAGGDNDSLAFPKMVNSLSSYVDSFLESREESGKKANKEIQGKKRLAIEEFVELIGDKPVTTYDFNDAESFRSMLRRLPSKRKTSVAYRDLTHEEILDLNLDRSQCFSDAHIRRTLLEVKALFEWLKGRKLVSDNPFDTVSVTAKHQSYAAFSGEDFSKLFSGSVFHEESGDATRSRWWLLLIAAYTGARMGEICQLRLSDVVESDGVLCFSINDEDGKSLKTQSANRLIPVHPVLMELGFKEYLEEIKSEAKARVDEEGLPVKSSVIDSGGLLLLPSIWNGKAKAGKTASTWFGRYRDSCSVKADKDERKVFHSFRHSFIQQAMSRDIELSKIQQMVGHESSLMGTTKTYAGDGYPASILIKELGRVEINGIDIDWLKKYHWSKIYKP